MNIGHGSQNIYLAQFGVPHIVTLVTMDVTNHWQKFRERLFEIKVKLNFILDLF